MILEWNAGARDQRPLAFDVAAWSFSTAPAGSSPPSIFPASYTLCVGGALAWGHAGGIQVDALTGLGLWSYSADSAPPLPLPQYPTRVTFAVSPKLPPAETVKAMPDVSRTEVWGK